MAEVAQCHCTFMYGISAIVGHSSPDFEGVNYSMRRLQNLISNKNILRNLVGNMGYGPEWLIYARWCHSSLIPHELEIAKTKLPFACVRLMCVCIVTVTQKTTHFRVALRKAPNSRICSCVLDAGAQITRCTGRSLAVLLRQHRRHFLADARRRLRPRRRV